MAPFVADTTSSSLHDIKQHFDQDEPLFIYIPPRPIPVADSPPVPELPGFLRGRSVATIGYRWFPDLDRLHRSPLHWPTPIHDLGFAWNWIFDNLRPPSKPADPSAVGHHHHHRVWDVTIVGAYWGAGFAVSLALNSCFPRPLFGIRNVMAFNGIYNWTMFLPKHQVNRSDTTRPAPDMAEEQLALIQRRLLARAQLSLDKRGMSYRFNRKPEHMFDPFASPYLFFRTEDIHVPHHFFPTRSRRHSDVKWEIQRRAGPPRPAKLYFPPAHSGLELPQVQLFYTPLADRPKHEALDESLRVNCYEEQARRFAEAMRWAVMRKEVVPFLKGCPPDQLDELRRLPEMKVRCNHLTDAEYAELRLIDEGGEHGDAGQVDNAFRTIV